MVVWAGGKPPRSPPSRSGVPPARTYLVTTPAERYRRRHTKFTDVTGYASGAVGAGLRGHRRPRLHIRGNTCRFRGSVPRRIATPTRPIEGIQSMRKLCASKEKRSVFAHDDPQAIFLAAWVWSSITVKLIFYYHGNPAE